MEQKAYENLTVFLRNAKHCSNVESQVPLKEKLHPLIEVVGSRLKKIAIPQPQTFGIIDAVGGSIYEIENPTAPYYGIELHCIYYPEPTSSESSFREKVGEIFWCQFIMAELRIWIDHLYFYIMLPNAAIMPHRQKFCAELGIGLLSIDKNLLVTEVQEPQDRQVERPHIKKIEATCPYCVKAFQVTGHSKDFNCPICNKGPLCIEKPKFFSVCNERIQRTSRRLHAKIPKDMAEEMKITPTLEKVFRNWENVQKSLHWPC